MNEAPKTNLETDLRVNDVVRVTDDADYVEIKGQLGDVVEISPNNQQYDGSILWLCRAYFPHLDDTYWLRTDEISGAFRAI